MASLHELMVKVAQDRILGTCTMRSLWILAQISTVGTTTVKELAEAGQIAKPPVTRGWTALASKGLVMSGIRKTDRRVTEIRLSKKGAVAVERTGLKALADPVLRIFLHGKEAVDAGLTMRQALLLVHICAFDEPEERQLRKVHTYLKAAGFNINRPALVRAMDRLEALGLGRRQDVTTDRRLVCYNPTAEGAELAKRINTAWSRQGGDDAAHR